MPVLLEGLGEEEGEWEREDREPWVVEEEVAHCCRCLWGIVLVSVRRLGCNG